MKRKPIVHRIALATLCVLSVSPALVLAGETPKPSEERGVIKSVDLAAHTLVVTERKKHKDQTFQWNDQTKFLEHAKSAGAGDLKAGEQVRLTYTAGSPTPTLQSVHIAPAKSEKPGAKNNSPAKSPGA